MQAFANVATAPERRNSKATGKPYWEFRVCESQRGTDSQPTWFTVRMMCEANPGLLKGDFVRVTGKLKVDHYLSREGKPTGTLLIIAFEATKLARKAAMAKDDAKASSEEHSEG